MANSVKLWEGPSELDGAPIMVIATGIKSASQNKKTGAMVQTYIIRKDMSPTDAIHIGADESICGKCPHRGSVTPVEKLDIKKRKQFESTARRYDLPMRESYNTGRTCYVVVFQGPQNAYKYEQNHGYPEFFGEAGAELLRGLPVRLGTYGDPAAVPLAVWDTLLKGTANVTGYTHQWQICSPEYSRYCMASADLPCEAIAAQAMGYRTFRIGTKADSKAKGEFLCPASEEAGKKLNCESCLACGGTSSKNRANVFIPIHGAVNKVRDFEERSRLSES